MKWYNLPGKENSDQPFVKKVKAGSRNICLIGYKGKVFVLSAKCPHAGVDLTQGWCNNGKLVCPIHRYSFDLHSGKGSPGQNDYINSYPVEIRKQTIYVGIKTFWGNLKHIFDE